jgi:hypothetical protein
LEDGEVTEGVGQKYRVVASGLSHGEEAGGVRNGMGKMKALDEAWSLIKRSKLA